MAKVIEIPYQSVESAGLLQFLEEDVPQFLEFEDNKFVAVLVSDILLTKDAPLTDERIAEKQNELLQKATGLLSVKMSRNGINASQTMRRGSEGNRGPKIFINVAGSKFEFLDLSSQACELGQHKYEIVFYISASDFVFFTGTPGPEPALPIGDPPEENPFPSDERVLICDYDTFRNKLKTIGRFFRFYNVILKNPKKGYFVTGVSYKSNAFTKKNKGAMLRFADNFKDFLEDLAVQNDLNKDFYIPTFNNKKSITIFFKDDLSGIQSIKFERKNGCEKEEEFLFFDEEDLEKAAFTRRNTNWFISSHERSFPYVASSIFSTVSRKKIDPYEAVTVYFLPPGASLNKRKCFSELDLNEDLGDLIKDGLTELALENGVRDLFEEKPLKTLEDVMKEDNFLNSAEFSAFRRKMGKKRIKAPTLQDLILEALSGGADELDFKKAGEDLQKDFKAFMDGSDFPALLAFMGVATIASRAINGLIDTENLHGFVAGKMADLLADSVNVKRLLRKIPLNVLLNIVGSIGLFSPTLLAAMASSTIDNDIALRQRAEQNKQRRIEQSQEKLSNLREELETNSDLPEQSSEALERAQELAILIEQEQQSLEFLQGSGSDQTDEELYSGITNPDSPFTVGLLEFGFSLSEIQEIIRRVEEDPEAGTNLSKTQSLLIQIIIMGFECSFQGSNKKIVQELSKAIIDAIGLDDLLDEFDEFSDYLTSWDIREVDFCNLPDLPSFGGIGGLGGGGGGFNGINFPRLRIGGLLAALMPLLLRALLQIVGMIILMVIRTLLRLIPDIPLSVEICEIANFIRDTGADLREALCRTMKGGKPKVGNIFAQRGAELLTNSFSTKNSTCNFLGLVDASLDNNPTKNQQIAECFEDFCSIMPPDTSYRFLKGQLNDDEGRMYIRVLENSGRDVCKEFGETLKGLENFLDVINDLGFVIGEAVQVDDIFDNLVPIEPGAPSSMRGFDPLPSSVDVCADPSIVSSCYENISDERLRELMAAGRDLNSRLLQDAVGMLTGQTSFDEMFRNYAPPPLHPSEMLDDEGNPQMSSRAGATPSISRDAAAMADVRRSGFAMVFAALSLNFDGDIKKLIKKAEKNEDLGEDLAYIPAAAAVIDTPFNESRIEISNLGALGRYDLNYEISNSIPTIRLEGKVNFEKFQKEVRNKTKIRLRPGLFREDIFKYDLDRPITGGIIDNWLLDHPRGIAGKNNFYELFYHIVSEKLTADTAYFDSFKDGPDYGADWRLTVLINSFARSLSSNMRDSISTAIQPELGEILLGAPGIIVATLQPAATKRSLTNPAYLLQEVEMNYFEGFLQEALTTDRFNGCSKKYSKLLSRLRDDEVAILNGTLKSSIDAALLDLTFQNFFSVYALGSIFPDISNNNKILLSLVENRIKKFHRLREVDYARMVLFAREIQRLKGIDPVSLLNNPSELRKFLSDSIRIVEEVDNKELLREIIRSRQQISNTKYFQDNIKLFKNEFEQSFKSEEGAIEVESPEDLDDEDENFVKATVGKLNTELIGRSLGSMLFGNISWSDDLEAQSSFIPLYFPSINLTNGSDEIDIARILDPPLRGGAFSSVPEAPGSLSLMGYPRELYSSAYAPPTPALRGANTYSLLSRVRFKSEFVNKVSSLGLDFFGTLQGNIEDDDRHVHGVLVENLIEKLKSGFSVEMPYEDFFVAPNELIHNSSQLLLRINNLLFSDDFEALKQEFDYSSPNDILNILDIKLGLRFYLFSVTDYSDLPDDTTKYNIFTKEQTTNQAFVKLGDRRDDDDRVLGNRRNIKLLNVAENFVSVSNITYPARSRQINLASFRLENGFKFNLSDLTLQDINEGEATITESQTKISYINAFYNQKIIKALIENSEIEEFLTFVFPVDPLLAALSIYYSEYLQSKENDPDVKNFFSRGFFNFRTFTTDLFKEQARRYKKKKLIN